MGINGEHEELERLSRLKFELEEQDTLILELSQRAPNSAVGAPQITVLESIFNEVNSLRPRLLAPFTRTDDPDNLRPQIRSARARVDEQIKMLQQSFEAAAKPKQMRNKIFIGHGRSLVWHQLKAFLNDRLHRACAEFNSDAVAGMTTTARLEELLDEANFAFLVMTADDMHANNSFHARENVIHEAGLFQGRLGFHRAIILLEDGCTQFSNIHGLTHIAFPKGNLEPAFEKIRQVLEREDMPRQEELAAANSGFKGEKCPRCSRNGWHVESSSPDLVFGELGVANRVYKCHFCGFSESKLAK
jgi:predicted nucleotide-binding protein